MAGIVRGLPAFPADNRSPGVYTGASDSSAAVRGVFWDPQLQRVAICERADHGPVWRPRQSGGSIPGDRQLSVTVHWTSTELEYWPSSRPGGGRGRRPSREGSSSRQAYDGTAVLLAAEATSAANRGGNRTRGAVVVVYMFLLCYSTVLLLGIMDEDST